ncbi:helix-turn-helix domain-containing protein [Methylobacterium sp. WL12]|uniref:helix-turn-helix domain-containing protein n=1 Tax=Methylobacterium sp. WL12 TaxID=2603890 RepID=UPI0011C8DD51|nr:helix-turn-helix domain-containing protein [Methylobacterium sp. WL12]TXM66971.1 helix-turn-helix domain-containing protein [Methylobacterium sp. WL12]
MGADDTTAEVGLPHFFLTTSGLPPGEAFERWRSLCAPMYEVSPTTRAAPLPFGSNIAYPIDDLVCHRTRLSTQRLQRDSRRVDAGPDHYMVQIYRSGRFQGTVGGKSLSASRGTVTFIGRRHLLDGILDRADGIGIAVPCARLHGLPFEAHGLLFDAARNRLLAARILDIYRRLPTTRADKAPALADEFVAFLRRLLDPSQASDVLEGCELHGGLRALAGTIVQENLSRPNLSPEFIAGQMQVSRATLYRLFEPEGGVMHFVQGERLKAVRDALADPMETRTLGRLAEVFAFSSLSQLSRSFRNRYGVPPQAWRTERRVAQRIDGQGTLQNVWAWLRER